jgi:serine/threonine protein kinase
MHTAMRLTPCQQQPANLLLCANGHLKVTDFGLSIEAKQLGTYSMTGGTGSLRFMAPEVFTVRTVLFCSIPPQVTFDGFIQRKDDDSYVSAR